MSPAAANHHSSCSPALCRLPSSRWAARPGLIVGASLVLSFTSAFVSAAGTPVEHQLRWHSVSSS